MSLEKANLLIDMGRHADAERELRALLAVQPDDALAHAMLGVALSRLGRSREAVDEGETATGLAPANSYVFSAYSLVLIQANHPAGALRAICEAIKLDSSNAESFLILGALLFDKGQWGRCLAALDRALAIEPSHVGCLNLRSQTLLKLGRREEAEQAVNAALAAGPEDADAHHARSVLSLRGAEAAAAIDHLLEARRLNPLEKNDPASIALATGRGMVPFRWMNAALPRFYLWRPKRAWGLFSGLLCFYVILSAWFPLPWGDDRLSRLDRRNLPSVLFGGFIANLLLAPFTVDALAAVAAMLGKQKLVGTTGRMVAWRVFVVMLLLFCHEYASIVGFFPPLVVLILCIGSCGGFPRYMARCLVRHEPKRATTFGYALTLMLLIVAMMVLIERRQLECLAVVAPFALSSFFSENVLHFARGSDRYASPSALS